LELVVAKRFSFVRLGHSMRATELEAAIGVAQFEGRDDNISSRQDTASFYTKNLASLSDHLQLPHVPSAREGGS
jgi:dTDP-4-amino-4,6-dideoxygalactose transaminase